MAKYFSRKKYQKDIIDQETFKEWKKLNPKSEVTYSTFLDYWHLLRKEIFDSIGDNPAGVDLPFYMGNLSIKVIDVDFKCAKDFLSSTVIDRETGQHVRIPYVQSELPKKVKIAWIKHKLFKSLPSVLGVEACRTMKATISAKVRNNVNKYEKAFGKDKIKSKCDEPTPEINPFDQ